MSVYIVGAGGFSTQIAECLTSIGGYYDDGRQGATIIGPISSIDPTQTLMWALGDVQVRYQRLQPFLDCQWIEVVHPRAYLSASSHRGRSNYFGPHVSLMPRSRIGDFNLLDPGVIVSHDVCLGSWNHLAGNAVLLGGVTIGDRNLVGANATILPGITIGSDNVIGAGAVVTKNLGSHQVVKGIPAR